MKRFKLNYTLYSHDQPLLLVNGGGASGPVRSCLDPPVCLLTPLVASVSRDENLNALIFDSFVCRISLYYTFSFV